MVVGAGLAGLTAGRELQRAGYSVLVVNPFYRMKKAPTGDTKTPIPQLMPLAQSLTATTEATDARAFIAWLDQQPSVFRVPG